MKEAITQRKLLDGCEPGAIWVVAGASRLVMIQRSTNWYEMDKDGAGGMMMLQYTPAIHPVINAISSVQEHPRRFRVIHVVNDATKIGLDSQPDPG